MLLECHCIISECRYSALQMTSHYVTLLFSNVNDSADQNNSA